MGASLYNFSVWLQNCPIGMFMQNSLWPFPTMETVHIMGIVVVVGSATILDLRLMGLILKRQSVSSLAKQTLPWAWVGFLIQVVSGFLLYATEATKLYFSIPFRLKMLMVALVGINVLVFHVFVYRDVDAWDTAPEPPLAARLTGWFSILLWLGIITAGRWIAFY